MMNCKTAILLLNRYLDGELDQVTLSRLEEHLSVCRSCARELQALRTTSRLFESARSASSVPVLWSSFSFILRREEAANRNLFQFERLSSRLVPVAAALLLAVGLTLLLLPRSVPNPVEAPSVYLTRTVFDSPSIRLLVEPQEVPAAQLLELLFSSNGA